MNIKIANIIQEHKEKFLIDHELYEKEYAPYIINCKGYAVDDTSLSKLISFKITTNKLISIGEVISVKTSDGNKDVKVTERNYEEDKTVIKEYPDSENVLYGTPFPHSVRHYRRNFFEITDEEYDILKQVYTEQAVLKVKPPVERGGLSTALLLIGMAIILVGVIAGFYLADESGVLGFITGFISCLQGLLIIAVGEIVHLLNIIANK